MLGSFTIFGDIVQPTSRIHLARAAVRLNGSPWCLSGRTPSLYPKADSHEEGGGMDCVQWRTICIIIFFYIWFHIICLYLNVYFVCVLDGQPGFCLLFVWFIIYSILVLCTCLGTIHKLDHISFCSCKKPTIVCRITSSYKLIWMILSMFSRSAVFPQSALAKYLPQMYTGQQVEQACLIVK